MLKSRVFLVALFALTAANIYAQVRCTMPNGLVIEQRLSDQCPHGARKAQTMDGRDAPVMGVVKVPPQPVVEDKRWRKSLRVVEGEYGRDWPLTINEGVLKCWTPVGGMPHVRAFTIEQDGSVYALNGVAMSHARSFGWNSLAPIWRSNPEIPGTKLPVSALIERASATCP